MSQSVYDSVERNSDSVFRQTQQGKNIRDIITDRNKLCNPIKGKEYTLVFTPSTGDDIDRTFMRGKTRRSFSLHLRRGTSGFY